MPYLEDTDQTEMTNNSVFIPVNNEPQSEQIEEPPTSSPEARRSTRSTRGQSRVKYGKGYTFDAVALNASNQPS